MALGDDSLPIIGVPKQDLNSGTKVVKFGKYVGTLYPEIYQQFVFKLHKEHPDLMSAMVMAQVNLEDGSAVGFLAKILGVDILSDMTMEVGFGILYAGLEKRQGSRMLARAVLAAADDVIEEKLLSGKYREDEDIGKPLFPDAEEMFDKDRWAKKKFWKERDASGKDRVK